ncbi:MAG: hypothetical protein PF689_10230, partial [Deltaproteobacteria bacterium]|nr:hypothetical protein [Deltaproteobacteria bacterium]
MSTSDFTVQLCNRGINQQNMNSVLSKATVQYQLFKRIDGLKGKGNKRGKEKRREERKASGC